MRKIGLLIPKTNLTVEHELQYLFNKNILDCNDYIFYTAKLDYKTSYKENKEQYLKDLAEDSNNKIEDLKYLDVDYVGYFCTSSAIVSENLNISNNPAGALVEEAKLKNVTVVGLVGAKDCKMDNICDYIIKVPSESTPTIQESHIMIGHIICALVEEAIFKGESPKLSIKTKF